MRRKPPLAVLLFPRQTMHPRALVVHFHPDAGMANRIGVLISALALAIATDRALLMDWPPVVAHWHPAREYIALPAVERLLEPPFDIKWRWSESREWLPKGGDCQRKRRVASRCLVTSLSPSPHPLPEFTRYSLPFFIRKAEARVVKIHRSLLLLCLSSGARGGGDAC